MDRYEAMEKRRAEVLAMLHPDGSEPLGGSGGSAGRNWRPTFPT